MIVKGIDTDTGNLLKALARSKTALVHRFRRNNHTSPLKYNCHSDLVLRLEQYSTHVAA